MHILTKNQEKLQWNSPYTQKELHPLVTDLPCPVNGAVIAPFRVRAVTLPRTLCWHWYPAFPRLSPTRMAGSHRLKGGEAPPSDTRTPLSLHLPPPASPPACFTTGSSLPPYVHTTKERLYSQGFWETTSSWKPFPYFSPCPLRSLDMAHVAKL